MGEVLEAPQSKLQSKLIYLYLLSWGAVLSCNPSIPSLLLLRRNDGPTEVILKYKLFFSSGQWHPVLTTICLTV